MENEELVNELWQNVLNRMQRMDEEDPIGQGYTALLLNTKVNYNDDEHLLTIEFPADSEAPFRVVTERQTIRNTVQEFVQDEFGSAVTCKIEMAETNSSDLSIVKPDDTEDEISSLTIEEIEKLPCVVPLFTKRFNYLLEHANTNKKQFMRETGLSDTVFSEMRRGTRNSFRRKTLRRACGGLDCSDRELLVGTEFESLLPPDDIGLIYEQIALPISQEQPLTLGEMLEKEGLYLHKHPGQKPKRFAVYEYMTDEISSLSPEDQIRLIVALFNFGGYSVDTEVPLIYQGMFNNYKKSIMRYRERFEETRFQRQLTRSL